MSQSFILYLSLCPPNSCKYCITFVYRVRFNYKEQITPFTTKESRIFFNQERADKDNRQTFFQCLTG